MGQGPSLSELVLDEARNYIRLQSKRGAYPRLNADACHIIGPCDTNYNCIAWSIDHPTLVWPAMRPNYWWPLDLYPTSVWPNADDQHTAEVDVAKLTQTPSVFIPLYIQFGFQAPTSTELASEAGARDVVIYCKDDLVTHAARRDGLGDWTSKLGWDGPLIQHSVADLEDGKWGSACYFLRKMPKPSK